MLKLHTFPPFRGTVSASPFTTKVDALLCMAGLPFERVHADVRKAPRGKLPVLVDGDRVIPDSTLIEAHLVAAHGADFTAGMDARDRALDTAIRRMCEHHLYFLIGHFRWTLHPDTVREGYFAEIPRPLRGVVFGIVSRTMRKTARLQGLGRFTEEEKAMLARQDIDALADLLGERPFYFGEAPRSVDACVFGAIHTVLRCDLDTPARDAILARPTLVDFEERLRSRLYDDAMAPRGVSAAARSAG
ncbi:glutathione S-transferase family protein [Palleronia sediminis]|nr:glutathione S-transferase family protein [Palleronia sediminis]